MSSFHVMPSELLLLNVYCDMLQMHSLREGRERERGRRGEGEGEREPQQYMVRRWTWNVPSITPLSKQYYTYSMQTYTTPEYTVQAIKSTRQVRTFIHLVCTVESSKCAYTNTTHSSTPSQPHCCQLYKPPPHN